MLADADAHDWDVLTDLQAFLRMYRKIMDQHTRKFINTMTNQLHPTTQFPADPFRQYKGAVDVAGKLWPIFLGKHFTYGMYGHV